jgi:glycosyltransferase involved in cell wall biosynthesis
MSSPSRILRRKKAAVKVVIKKEPGSTSTRKKLKKKRTSKVKVKIKKRGLARLRKRRLKKRWRLRRFRKKGARRSWIARRRRRLASVIIPEPAQIAVSEPGVEQVEQPEEPGYRKGINIVGFIRAEMGIGESSRLASKSLSATDVPFDILNFPVTNIRMEDRTWAEKEVEHPDYKINIFHMNADTMRTVHHHFGQSLFERRYNIGYWHWELPEFPDEFCDGFEFVQEVWAPSSFVVDSIAKKSPVPVVRIPHGIEVFFPPHMNRGTFGLPDNRFLFFSMYDTHSYQRRKNPQGAIDAFMQAFDRNDPTVGLVVKLNHSHANPGDIKILRELVKGYNNIYILDRIMSREEVNALLNCTDSFVSLHRSEGFGLGLAEAMYLGKPVLGTYWSGNTDFMNFSNSCPVGYNLTQVGGDWGPYKAYQTWADPDIEHAAHAMREVRYNEQYRKTIAINGQSTIRNEFSPQAVGLMMKNRLKELGLL